MTSLIEYKFVCKHIDLFLNDIKKKKGKCSICLDFIENNAKLKCGHEFCLHCLKEWISEKNTCPLCRYLFKQYINNNKITILKQQQINKTNETEEKEINEIETEETQELCNICGLPGRLLICDLCEGTNGYAVHVVCAGYEREDTPDEEWFCPWCN